MQADNATPPVPTVSVAATSVVSTSGVSKRRACASCTDAKIKCVRRAEGDLCERCRRLGRQCVYLDLPQRRRKQGSTRRLDRLQARFDDLEARLADSNRSFIDGTVSSESPRPAAQHLPSSSLSISLPSPADTLQPTPSRSIPPLQHLQTLHSTSGLSNGYVDIVSRGIITLERADALLADFRQHHTPLFPFAVLGSDESVKKLRNESPLLFLATSSVALCAEPSLQRLLGEEFQGIISSQIFRQGGKNLDALRALLVYAAWNHYFAASEGHSQLFLQAQLCVSLVYYLKLDVMRELTSTEIRALLGTYWLSTCASIALRRPPAMRYSKQMEGHCEHLAAASEYETDRLVRPLVLTQSLCCRVYDTFNFDNLAAGTPIRGDASIRSMVDVFMHELELIKTSSITDTWSLADSNRILMEFSYVESCIREGALHRELWHDGPQGHTRESTRSMPIDYAGGPLSVGSPVRLAMLWRMLDTDRACIRHFVAFTETNLHRVPVTISIRICYALANLIRLVFALMGTVLAAEQPKTAFDTAQPNTRSTDAAHPTALVASESISVICLVDELATRFETSSQLHPMAAAGGCFPILMGFATKLRKLSRAYRHKLQDIGAVMGSSQGGAELMAECGGLGPTQPGQTNQLHESDRANGRPPESTAQEWMTGAQSDSWPLADETAGFNFDEREWDALMETFTLPE